MYFYILNATGVTVNVGIDDSIGTLTFSPRFRF